MNKNYDTKPIQLTFLKSDVEYLEHIVDAYHSPYTNQPISDRILEQLRLVIKENLSALPKDGRKIRSAFHSAFGHVYHVQEEKE